MKAFALGQKSLHEQLKEMKRKEREKNQSGGVSHVPAHLREKPKELYDMVGEMRSFII
jgi:hypothetical protein